jgi:hypothetical protein
MSGFPIGAHFHSVILGCQEFGSDVNCYIPLPRQSPLGIYEGLQYRPIGEWPAVFLCLRHGLLSEYWPDSIHLEFEPIYLGRYVPLWRVECTCGHKSCGRMCTMYTARMPNWDALSQRIVDMSPKLECDGHDFEWKKELMTYQTFAHDAPMP